MAEFMVGMTLSGLSLGMLVTVQLRMQSSMKQQTDAARSLKSSNQALNLIASAVRSAGAGFPMGAVQRSKVGYGAQAIPSGLTSTPAVRMNHYLTTAANGDAVAGLQFGKYYTKLQVSEPYVQPVVYPVEVYNERIWGGATGGAGLPDQLVISRGDGPVAYGSMTGMTLKLSTAANTFLEGGEIGDQLLLITRVGSSATSADDVACVVGATLPAPDALVTEVNINLPYGGTANNSWYSLCQGVGDDVRVQRFKTSLFGLRADVTDDCVEVRGEKRAKGVLMQADLGVSVEGMMANFRLSTSANPRGKISVLGDGYSNLQVALNVADSFVPGYKTIAEHGTVYSIQSVSTCEPPTSAVPGQHWYSGENMEGSFSWAAAMPGLQTISSTLAGSTYTIIRTCPTSGPPERSEVGYVRAVSVSVQSRTILASQGTLCSDGAAAAQPNSPSQYVPGICDADPAFNSVGDAPPTAADCVSGIAFSATGEPTFGATPAPQLNDLYFPDATYSTNRVVVTVANQPEDGGF